jgi:hypothetical protein
MVQLVQQQQEQQPDGAGAAAAAGTDGPAVAAVQPFHVVMALWAASSAGIQKPKQRQLLALFEYLNQPEVLQQLTANTTTTTSSSSNEGPLIEEVVRTCGTVIWAAAQLGFTGDLILLKPYASALLEAAESAPVACTSTLTVVLSLASLLQQQQQGTGVAAADVQYWQGCFLQCCQAVVASMQQQQQGQQYAAAVASQLLWGCDVAGCSPPQEQLQALIDLTGDEVRHITAARWC